jgi:hypothetical protein
MLLAKQGVRTKDQVSQRLGSGRRFRNHACRQNRKPAGRQGLRGLIAVANVYNVADYWLHDLVYPFIEE